MTGCIAVFGFEEGSIEELARAIEMCRHVSSVPVRVTVKSTHEGAELAEASLLESSLTDGRTLLNGECGRLDCGTVDGILLDAMKGAGIDTEVK